MIGLLAAAIVKNMTFEDVSPDRLKATVEKLASWHDRNTNNETLNQAAEWIADQLRVLPGMNVEIWKYPIAKSARVPEAKEVVEVIATLPGKTDRRVIVGGHFDTINMTDPHDYVSGPAPGANDDASGVALMMECARQMAGKTWNDTAVFVAFSGEEQGLLGSAALAKRAKQEGWKIDAVLSNDMVGNSRNNLGMHDDKHIRVFSEESDLHNSRELARFVDFLGRDGKAGVKPMLIFRKDRFGRGGDHSSFNQEDFTAIRFVEVHEEYSRQHTPNDRPEFVDFNYLASNTRLNLLVLESLANAGPPPTHVRVDRRQGYDARLSWNADPGQHYVVYWRETTSPVWQEWRNAGESASMIVKGVDKDNHVFAVGAKGGIPVEAR